MIEVYAPTIRRKEMDAVLTAMVDEKIGPGEQSHRLVLAAKESLRFEYALALRSPALALDFALRCFDLAPGDGVILSALSPAYYLTVLNALGLVPLFCDVEEGTVLPGAASVSRALEAPAAPPRCILLYHSLGFRPATAEIAALGLPIIEDLSQSYGTTAQENEAGSGAAFSILGLEERDMLTAGGGALLFCMDRRTASVLRNRGDLPPEYGLPDLNAALAVIQLKEAPKNLEKRAAAAEIYGQAALKTRHRRLFSPAGDYNNYAFPLALETGFRDAAAYARRGGVETALAFETAACAAEGLVERGACPLALSLALRTAVFPLYPRLSRDAIAKTAKVIATLP